MNQDAAGAPEIITLAGVRERKAAYEEECKRKQEVQTKTKITLFRVEDGKMHDSFSHSGSGDQAADGSIREHTSNATLDFDEDEAGLRERLAAYEEECKREHTSNATLDLDDDDARVRERRAAYEEECKRKQEVQTKTKITLFRVEDGIMHESFSQNSNSGDQAADGSIREQGASAATLDFDASVDEQERPEGDNVDDDKSVGADELDLEPGPHGSSSAFDYSSRPDLFRGTSFGSSGDEAEQRNKEPKEKTPEQIKKDQQEEEAKKTFTILLEKENDQKASAPVILQSFSSLQKRYLSAVTALRPNKDKSGTDASSSTQKIMAELRKEAMRKDRFNSLKSSYNAYAEAAQDKREEVEDIQVEEEIEKIEDEVVEEWVDYAEKAVEKVEILVESAAADGTETSADDEADNMAEMARWREEAKKLKQEAAERKQRKAAQDAYRAERKHKAKERAAKRAEYLKRKKERAEKKKAETEAAAADEEEAQEQATAEDKQLQEEQEAADQKALEDRIMAQQEAEEAKKRQAQQAAVAAHEAEIEAKMKEQEEAELAEEQAAKKTAEVEDAAKAATKRAEETKKKSDHHDKKKGEHGKKKKKEKKDKHNKKTGDEGGDGSDAEDEKFPRNLDGTIWKNVLKFWTNKPKSLKEKGSKVIMTSVPGSDCFRRSADSVYDNASFYWHKVEGDFDCVVHIKGDLARPYDKAGIMLRVDEKNWVMSGVEYFGEQLNNACCITREISDWSLAPLPEEAKKGCWFCVKRIGNKVESFYSMDRKNWVQTRQGLFTEAPTLKVGIATGSPMGESFKVTFDMFWLKKKQKTQAKQRTQAV